MYQHTFMCIDHWRTLPEPMKSDIRRTWVARVDALTEYREAVRDQERGTRRALRAVYDGAAAEHEATKRRAIEAVAGAGAGR